MIAKYWLLRKATGTGLIPIQIPHPAVPHPAIVNSRKFTISWLIKLQMTRKEKLVLAMIDIESSKSGWLKNRLDKEKAKAGSKSFVQNQQRRGSKKVMSEWKKITLISGSLSFVTLSAMSSSLVNNTNQVHFASVLAMDNSEIVAMFEALVASGLNDFLCCMSDILESALIEFYHNASIQDDKVVSTVQENLVEISEEIFAQTFQMPVEGLIDINEVPKDFIFDARTEFSFTCEQLSTSCKKRELNIEYRLLSDIVAKSITVKAGSFDAVTHERFLLMTAIFGGVSVNWGRLLFKIFKDMVTPETRQARGYAVHISILLKNIPDLELGDSEEFPALKILTAKTVGRYIATNDKIVVDSVEGLAGKSRVKKTPVKRAESKKRPAVAIEEQVVKKKQTLNGKAAPTKAKQELVSVALDAEPLQTVDPTSADDVNTIIEQVIAEYAQLDTDVGSPVAPKADEMEQWLNLSYEEFIASDANRRVDTASDTDGELETVVEKHPVQRSKNADFGASEDLVLGKKNEGFLSNKPTDEELMSLDDLLMQISDDMMLPSVTAAEKTKIKFGLTVEIHEVQDTDWHYASLPKISAHDKGKKPLEEDDVVKGNPAREMVQLICGDVEFLVQLREQVIQDVVSFFHSFSLSQLLDLESVRVIATKEKLMLNWAETTSLETAEIFVPGQSWTAMASQIIDLLSAALLQSLDALLVQEKENGLIADRPCSSKSLDDSADSSGVVLAQFYSLAKSTCWVRPMVLINGIWTPLQGKRQEAHNETNFLSLGLKSVRTQTAILTTDQEDAHKEAKEQKAIIKDMDERLATLRSEQLDFRAQAQENYKNLSSHLGELFSYINRGNDKKGEESSSRRPQPPPDDQNRPSGGNANRGGGGGGSGGSG
ncbi:hypothetical protein F511_31785 [Dorcoceras hygrometricum]|uniref:Dystroglycan-like n=1 Tax=Dorcoceras hygrometricum TaxID=472368 RepID=A0A2Z7B8A0_9LAMI|nr:hypothetical protein F511_31785 [Dorcoceras hygrometricum]